VSTTRIVDIAALPGAREADERATELAWRLPTELAPLARIALDYRWAWDPDGPALFRALDPHAWVINAENPVRQLADLPPHAAQLAAGHGPTLERIARLERVLDENRARPETPVRGIDQPVVFVCAEFGIHPSLPIYSGGLGALAGDILKQASDLALPMIGVGLLYRKGYFHQRVDRTGLQHEYWTQIMPERLPTVLVLDESGAPLRLSFPLFGREVAFHVWRAEIGRVPLYLLDTELEENDPVDRWITARLYEGTRSRGSASTGCSGSARCAHCGPSGSSPASSTSTRAIPRSPPSSSRPSTSSAACRWTRRSTSRATTASSRRIRLSPPETRRTRPRRSSRRSPSCRSDSGWTRDGFSTSAERTREATSGRA